MQLMTSPTKTRRRPTDAARQAERLTRAVGTALGQEMTMRRTQLHLTQASLAAQVGCDQTRISQIEQGNGMGVPLRLWVALGVALGRPLQISFSRPLGEDRGPADAGHLAMQEWLLGIAHANGRNASFELPTRPLDPRRSIDVC